MNYQQYIYLNSTDSVQFYPTNSPGHFYSKLPQVLNFKGLWECALLQLQYVNSYFSGTESPRNLYICSNICSESTLFEKKIPVLRRVNNLLGTDLLNQTIEVDIKNLIYIPIIGESTDVISIYIIDDSSNPVVFSEGPVRVTLHLRQVRAFI